MCVCVCVRARALRAVWVCVTVCAHLMIKERKRFCLLFLPKYLIGREQKFQLNVSFDWSRNKRKAVDGLFPSAYVCMPKGGDSAWCQLTLACHGARHTDWTETVRPRERQFVCGV